MREVLTFKFKKQKRRAIELYDADSPFKGKVFVDRKKKEWDKPKYANKWMEDL